MLQIDAHGLQAQPLMEEPAAALRLKDALHSEPRTNVSLLYAQALINDASSLPRVRMVTPVNVSAHLHHPNSVRTTSGKKIALWPNVPTPIFSAGSILLLTILPSENVTALLLPLKPAKISLRTRSVRKAIAPQLAIDANGFLAPSSRNLIADVPPLLFAPIIPTKINVLPMYAPVPTRDAYGVPLRPILLKESAHVLLLLLSIAPSIPIEKDAL